MLRVSVYSALLGSEGFGLVFFFFKLVPSEQNNVVIIVQLLNNW